MTEELATLIRELHAAGEIGLLILVVVLIALVCVGAALIFLQRQALRRLQAVREGTHATIAGIEIEMKKINSLREESLGAVKVMRERLNATVQDPIS